MLTSAAVTVALTSSFLATHRSEYQKRYQALCDQVASTFHELEVVTDMAGQAVLETYRDREAQGAFNSVDDLRRFAEEMGVNAILTYSNDGVPAYWTHPPADPSFIAFDICADYVGFFSGAIDNEVSPFVPVAGAPSIKFFKAMNAGGDQLVNIALYSDFLEDLLRRAFRDNVDVVALDVQTPSGVSLRTGSHLSPPDPSTTARFFSHTLSTVRDCCQCVQKGLATTRDGYHYNVVVDVSLRPLQQMCRAARFIGLMAFLFSAVASVAIAHVIARHLVSRIENIDAVAANVFKSGDLNIQVPGLDEDDEIGRLSTTLNAMLTSLRDERDQAVASERAASVAKHARQVAHDIRSPLAAIRMALSDLGEAPEETRNLLRSATFRIEDIANQLFEANLTHDKKAAQPKEEIRPVLLPSVLEIIVSEKRTEYRQHLHVNIEYVTDIASYGLFVAIIPSEFKRVISNMINNAVEALSGAGTVRIRARKQADRAIIEIADDGRGMPPHILAKLGHEEVTHGKTQGHGIGVFSAQTALKRVGGRIDYTSIEGRGTCARVDLKRVVAPSWFLEGLKIGPNCRVVVADDDLSIHRVWDERFRRSVPDARLMHISSPKDLTAYIRHASKTEDVCYLVDYEFLGEDATGIDLIKQLGITEQSVLVTSRFDEEAVLVDCLKMGLRMIPKSAAEHVPIERTEKLA